MKALSGPRKMVPFTKLLNEKSPCDMKSMKLNCRWNHSVIEATNDC